MKDIKEYLNDLYLSYVNDFLTLERFAEHHNLDQVDARIILTLGRKYNEQLSFQRFDTLEEIKNAVNEGKKVYWSNDLYEVKYDEYTEKYYVICTTNDSMHGLTWKDGITLNGKMEDFYYKKIKGE
jgi:hypothetical protein